MVVVVSHLGSARLVTVHRSGDGVKCVNDVDSILW